MRAMGGWQLILLVMGRDWDRLAKMGLSRMPDWVPNDELGSAELYAALCAAGCPRLAFLLTDVDPRDPLDEELAKWKEWLYCSYKYEWEGAVRVGRYSDGFLVPTGYFEPLREEFVEEWLRDIEERQRKWGAVSDELARLDAMLTVDHELARFIELAEAGFKGPRMEGFFDRYIDALASVEGSFEDALFEKIDGVSGEELAEWAALGAGKLDRVRDDELVLYVKAKSSRELPRELREALRQRWERRLFKDLREVAALLAVARYAGVRGFVLAKWS